MKVSLVFPPLSDATQPYSSLPALAGFLRSRNRHEVLLHDANVEFIRDVLTGRRLEAAAAKIGDRLAALEGGSGSPARTGEYELLMNASLKAPIVSGDIDGAVADLKCPETFSDLARLDRAKRLVQDAVDVLSASCFPLSVRPSELADGFSSNAADVERLAQDRAANPFRAFFEDVTVPRLQSEAPGAIGISITYRSQVLPAATLALMIKRTMPCVPVIFGGNIASLWYNELSGFAEIFKWCDHLVAFEGESALDALLSALESGGQLDQVPNLAYWREGCVRKNGVLAEDIDALPAPDYRGLPLDLYLAPQPVFLLNTSRGCYWSKCEFCSVSPSMRHRFRMRRPELVLNDIAVLRERHSARCISFGDDCVPPRTLKALARGLQETGMEISWQCEVRFEPQLTGTLIEDLSKAGCRNLIFGLESYSPRVLSLMNKGVRHAEIRRILDDCRRHQVAFNLQLFFGFPGETERDARETLDFVTGELHGAATLSFGEFQLQRGSGVARRPASFGVRPAQRQEPMAINLAYEPVPEHAAEARRQLRAEISKRTRFNSLPLCIDAYTLLYLHEAGVGEMAKQYYGIAETEPEVAVPFDPKARVARRPRQVISEFRDRENGHGPRVVLYDYEEDRAVELSGLAQYVVVRGLDRPRSVRQIVAQLATDAGEGLTRPQVTTAVDEIVGGLVTRRMLDVIQSDRVSAAERICRTDPQRHRYCRTSS